MKIGREDILDLLLSFPAIEPNRPDREIGMAALHYAVVAHNRAIITKLCTCGAYVDVADRSGMTPLMLACGLPEYVFGRSRDFLPTGHGLSLTSLIDPAFLSHSVRVPPQHSVGHATCGTARGHSHSR